VKDQTLAFMLVVEEESMVLMALMALMDLVLLLV
jgi:hypothetical protein